ncbi:MAG: AAA family ATPase, partial [Candidatus Binatia bacterium]|nr:AAA family ATPase [Candidatus Binatia bacterium]
REREYLLNLESIMHRRLINQNHAVAAVARAMIRARAGVRNRHRPIGTFLFLGPTGVGKTETAKTLTEAYFGSEDYLTRLDMTEFQSEEAVAELIGSNARPVGRLTEQISDRPFTVLLLDEFEKAHAAVQQLFLQVLDEGWLTDVRGHQVSFRHAIIIATSNAGAQYIHEAVGQGSLPAGFDKQLQEYILEKNIFKPELINRFDGVITFTPLSPDHIGQIARLMLRKLNKQLDSNHGITVAATDELIGYLVAHGYNAQLGARPMNRLIQNTVEYIVAQKILRGHIQPGQQIFLSPEQLQQIPNT